MEILLLHSDKELVENIRYSFQKDGDTILTASSGDQALRLLAMHDLDFCLLGTAYPDGQVIDLLRQGTKIKNVPTIVLGKDPTPKEVVLCLEYGCLDYMRYPIDLMELKARIRVIARHLNFTGNRPTTAFESREGRVIFDLFRHLMKVENRSIPLTVKEFELVFMLVHRQGAVLSREELATVLWSEGKKSSLRTVDVYIRRLRNKLEEEGLGEMIETTWGKGYRYNPGFIVTEAKNEKPKKKEEN